MKSMTRLCGAVMMSVFAASAMLFAQLPIEPAKQFGTGVTPSYEGWFDNPDGSHNFLVGYLNRNRAQEVDIPIGPNNRIEPGGPDLGQPTHFLAGRQTGVFIVTVPKDFSLQQRLTWTLTINGQTNSIPFKLNADYNYSALKDGTIGNTPPVIRFMEKGSGIQGPVGTLAQAQALKTSVSMPLEIPVWADDDAKYTTTTGAPMRGQRPPVTFHWTKYRGTGDVKFDKDRPALEKIAGGAVNEPYKGKGTVKATFSAPGDYALHLTANDYSGEGGGGEGCCWTNAFVKVTVTP